MPTKSRKSILRAFNSAILSDAYEDFILSRQSKNSRSATISFYNYTARVFLEWAERQGVTTPREVTSKLVRQYLSHLQEIGRQDTTMHDHARAIKTMVRFWHSEGYLDDPIKIDMPKLVKKRLPILNAAELVKILSECNTRDKAIVACMADSGLRRGEIINLNWGDIDLGSGLIRVKDGKGGKDRSTVIGATTRRALLKYRQTLSSHADNEPVFLSRLGGRFTGTGILLIFRRLSKKTGIHVTPHAMRRTFTILSLRANMDVLHLQALGGWESPEMVFHYAQMIDDDLLQAHKDHSPMDNLRRLK